MRGVAEQRHAALGPLRDRVAVVDAPFVDVLDVAEHVEQRLVPALIGGEQLLLRAWHRPGFLDPLVGDVAGEDVEHRAVADRIADHVAVRPDPAEILAVRQLDRQPRARSASARAPSAPCSASTSCSVKRGLSAPNNCARMAERMPSAPITASASTSRPSAKRATALRSRRGRADAVGAEMDHALRQRVAQHAVQMRRGAAVSVGRAVFASWRSP